MLSGHKVDGSRTTGNVAPSFSSSATISVAENETAVVTVMATDSDADDDVTGYAITGGADQGFFSIGATSGALTFDAAPNYEDAEDQGSNNTYVVDVTATSGTDTRVMTATQTITVTVTDVSGEAPGKPGAPTVSSASATSLSVSWSAPTNAGPAITDYDYRHRTTSPQGSWTEVTGTTITTLSATIGSLAENTSYDVQVRATNDEGTGAWSDAGSGSTDAAPSDDCPENNTTTCVVDVGGSVTGEIDQALDVDWFAVDLESGTRYQFDVEGADTGRGNLADPHLWGLYDAEGQAISGARSNDGGVGKNGRVIYTSTADGTYYIAVSGAVSTTGTYTLSVIVLGANGNSEADTDFPNSNTTTGRVDVGASATGNIGDFFDEDWFRVDLEAGKFYQIDLEGAGGGGGTLVDPYLRNIRNSSGNAIEDTENDDVDADNDLYDSRIIFTPAATGVHYLVVSDADAATGTYTLSVREFTPPCTPDDDDIWCGKLTVGQVLSDSNVLSGHGFVGVADRTTGGLAGYPDDTMFSVGDNDYTIQSVYVGAGNANAGSLFFLLTADLSDDDKGDLVLTIDGDNTPRAFDDATKLSAIGLYTWGSTGLDWSSTPEVTVRLQVTPPAADDYPADTTTTGEVAVGGSVTGNIETAGDADWFKVVLEAGKKYQFKLEGAETTQGTLSDPYLSLYDGSSNEITNNDDSGTSLNSEIVQTLTAAGTYYLVAKGARATVTGTYTLSVNDITPASDDDCSADNTTTCVVVVGGSATGNIESANDFDRFRVDLEAGKTYQIDLEGAPTGRGTLPDPLLELRNADEENVGENQSSGVGANARIIYTADATGTYYAAAGEVDGATGTYTLSVIVLGANGASEADTDCPTGTTTTCQVEVGASATGNVSADIDGDWFKVVLEADKRYQIDLEGVDGGGGTLPDPQLYNIRDSSGDAIADTNNDDVGGEDDILDSRVIFTPTTAGTYYLEASSATGEHGTYTLSVRDITPLPDLPADTTTTGEVEVDGSAVRGDIYKPVFVERTGDDDVDGYDFDTDWFAVELEADRTYRIDMKGAILVAPGTYADPELTLSLPQINAIYDADGGYLFNTWSHDESSSHHLFRVTFHAHDSGTHYIAASGESFEWGGYELTVIAITEDYDEHDGDDTNGRRGLKNLRAVEEKGGVRLTWQPPDGAAVTGYRIERRRAGGQDSGPQRSHGQPRDHHTLVEDTGNTETSYVDESAEQGVEYEYRVTARNESGPGEESDWVRAGPEEEPVLGDGLPGAPRNLTATPGNKEVTLSWDPPADNGNAPATRYRIEWRVDGKDYDRNDWGTSQETTYTTNAQANLANGVKYFFRVKAGNDDGNSYGPYGPASEEVSATPTSGSAVDLGTPVLSDTETLHHGMVKLDWQDIEDAGWYVAQYYHLEGGEWLDLPAEGVDIAFHGSSAVVSNLHGLSWLRVGAASCDGASEWSQIEELYGTNASDWERVPVPEVEEGDQTEPCPVVLGTPVLSDTKTLHHGMVQLDWQDIEDAGWYVVQYYHLEGGEWLDLPAEGVDIAFHGSSAVVSNLHGLSWLRVGAASCDGASEWSQIEQLFGTNASDWKGVPVPDVAEGDEIEPCSEDADTSDNSPATGAPTISGTAQVGEALEADTSGVTDADGLSNVQYEYQWLADDADIAGASGSTYTLTDSEESKAIKVEVSFTDDAGNDESLTSEPTTVVAAAPPPPPDNVRAVSKKSGAVELTWDAPQDATVTGYRIERRPTDGSPSDQERSAGSTRDNHTLVEDTGSADTGYTDDTAERGVGYEYRVSARNEAGAGEESDWVNAEEEAASNSTATGAPTISGTAQVGETLTANTSGVADADGLSSVQYEYQWIADDTDIAGATGSTYTLTDSEESKAIEVQVSFTDDADNEETLTSVATTAVAGAVDSGAPSYITVEVTEDYSDPINIVTNFAITWNDAAVCSVDYNAYLNIKPSTLTGDETEGSQLHLGSAASDGAQITAGLTGVQGGVRGFDVELYCGTDGSGRLVSRVVIPGEYTRPKPGTYSSEPPLSALSVSHGTMTPTFQGGTSRYTVPDVANAETRITITATPKEGNFVKFFEGADSPVIGLIVDAWGLGPRPSGLSEDCSRGFGDYYGPLIEMTDADPDTPGLQVDLYDDKSYVWVHVYPTAVCTLGKSYALTITRAEGEVSLPRPNRPAIGLPVIAPPGRDPGWQGSHLYIASPCVGCTMNAFVSSIKDRDGWDESTFSYQWLADDADITGATSSSYTAADTDLGKTLKVRVSFTDDRGNEETLTSLATEVVRLRNFMPTGKPVILGTPEVGQTLRVDVSGISDPNGMTNATFTYQWVNTPWTDDEYTLADSDEGRRIWLQAAYTDDAGHMHMLESAPTDAVAARPSSPATGAPTISGTAQVGETLTVDTSGIADENGLENVAFTYQWLADDADIAGATGSTYTLVAEDEGKAITVQVSFTDDADNEETLTSGATDTVAGAQPTEPPAKPTGLDATATHDSVSLTWDDPGDDTITGYVILRRIPGVDPEGHFDVLVANTGTAATTYTDDTVSAETRYTYRIKAINGAGTSERSRWSHIDVPAAPVPDQPTGLEATESDGQVVLTWDDPGDDSITGYVILRRVRENDTGGDFSVLVADTGTAALTYTDDTVAAGTTYTYRIKAINEHGVSERSSWYHIDIPEAP